MKKSILLIVIVLCSFSMYAQNINLSKTTIVDAGIVKIENGEGIIDLPYQISPKEYFVVCTPMEQPANLYIANKQKNKCSIKTKDAIDIEVQYVIYRKVTKKQLVPDSEINRKTPNL